MATLTASGLQDAIQNLDLEIPIPQFTGTDVLNKPLDIIRSYLASILISLIEADSIAAYNSIALSSDPLHGDLTVVLPRLCPGTKAGGLANDLIKKARIT
jgi:arginyl-tRNA synthetase